MNFCTNAAPLDEWLNSLPSIPVLFCQYSSFSARIYHYMTYSRRSGRCPEDVLFGYPKEQRPTLAKKYSKFSFLFRLSCWKKNSLTFWLKTQLTRICLEVKVKLHVGKYPSVSPLLFWAPDEIQFTDLHQI